MGKSNTLSISGDMTIYEAEEIKTQFSQLVESEGDICVNLGNVSEIDSSGIQLMLALKKTVEEQSRKVRFEAHTKAVIDLFDLFDIATCFGDPIVMDSNHETE